MLQELNFKYHKIFLNIMEVASTQVNLRLGNNFLDTIKAYAQDHGYISIQELIREAIREKIADDLELRPEYKKKLLSKEANTFLSVEESKKFLEDLKKRVEDEKKKL